MAATCCNCGKEFTKGKKSYDRKSLYGQLKAKDVDKTFKDVIEDEFNVVLTPEAKERRFLCEACSWALMSMAKSKKNRKDAQVKLRETSSSGHYLAKKLRSPVPTPRKIKRQRVLSPEKKTEETTDPALNDPKQSPKKSKRISFVESDVNRALKYIRCRQYKRGITLLIKSRIGFRTAMFSLMQTTVRAEVSKMCQNASSAFKGGKTLDELREFNWDKNYSESVDTCPLLTECLIGAVTSKQSCRTLALASKQSVSAKPIIGALMAIILNQRKPRSFNGFQELNGMQMWLAGCKREMFSRFNHIGLSIGIKGTRGALDRIRKDYDSEVLEWKRVVSDYLLLPSDQDTSTSTTIHYGDNDTESEESLPPALPDADIHSPMDVSPQQTEKESECSDESTAHTTTTSRMEHAGRFGYSICFDNVNQKTTVRHQTRDAKNKMFNMVQGYAARDRIATNHMSDACPTSEDILAVPLESYLPSEMDEVDLRFEMTTLVKRILCKNVPAFKTLSGDVNWHIPHQYSKESARKSKMIPIGVLDKDESRVSDTIDIMEEYHKYVPITPNGDPMSVVLHADGLSVERGNNAQCARINANSPWQQLQGLTLNIQEWHKRCLLLQDIIDELFSASSAREKGTLCQLKNYFNHRNVTTNVKESFNHDEEFLDFCCDAYIILAALHFMDMNKMDQTPHHFPEAKPQQLAYLQDVSEKILDLVFLSCQSTVRKILDSDNCDDSFPYCVCKLDKPGATMVFCDNKSCQKGSWFHLDCLGMEEMDVPDGKWWCSDECKSSKSAKKGKKRKTVADNLIDNRRSYSIKVIWHGLNQKARRDAIRENDGKRMIVHWKFDLLNFYEHNHPKYFFVCHQLLTAIHGGGSPRLRHTLKWNRTVNPNGGLGKNIAMDLQMEHYNKEYKESVKDAAGQLTEATIARHSQMVGVGKTIRAVYENQVSGLSRSQVQKTPVADREGDFKEFIGLMIKENVFENIPGRSTPSFQDITLDLFKKTQSKSFRARLLRLRKQTAKRRDIVLQMQNT